MNEIDKWIGITKGTQQTLMANPEWKDRYAEYARLLLKNAKAVIAKKKLFNQFAPLFLYMNISNAKGSGIFSLRYAGQEVAELKVVDEDVRINTKKYDERNKRDFDCDVTLDNVIWNSIQASKFRRHFLDKPVRTKNSKKGNEEHRCESMLLEEFSKRQSKGKLLLGIQPVRLFDGITRFQMPTPLTASGNKIKYSGKSGGGVDILCRMGVGIKTKLCVMEVKDETLAKEPPSKAIKQAVAYAVFIRELLRSKSGNDWYKIFGFNRSVPDKLEIVASIAMPFNKALGSNFEKEEILLGDGDKLILHSVYFIEKERKLIAVNASFSQEV